MKKVLLFSIIFLFFATLSVFAYETVIIKYPAGELWEKAYYKKVGVESILQYVPKGQSQKSWNRAIIVHAYEHSNYPIRTFMGTNLEQMTNNNPTVPYQYLKLTDVDSIAGRCTNDYKNVKGQCEFYRVTRAHGGLISLHYINKDKNDFMANYEQWFDIIKKARYYNSYYRNERTFNKSEYFEL